jgi:L-ascorbate metabolism protein UlaG (beta-lactamase superfamily)
MRITKYPHSCFKVDKNNQALLIDIGNFSAAKVTCQDVGDFSAILITHQHADHIDPELEQWLQGKTVPIYGNQDVADAFPQLDITVVQNNQSLDIADFRVTPRDLPHCKMPDGSAGPPNTGYVIDGAFFHPGDGVAIDNLQVDTLAAPIAGPSVSILNAVELARQVGAKTVIPMHYDNPVFFNDPAVLAERFHEARVVILSSKQSVEV